MGEKGSKPPRFTFNRSLQVEGRPERLTGEAGALVLREVMERLQVVRRLTRRLQDPRDPQLVTHPLSELLRTNLLLLAQGWRDQDDADALRDDPALRLAVSDRRGDGPLELRPEGSTTKNPPVPYGLASQPTLSRLHGVLSTEANRSVLGDALLDVAAARIRAKHKRGKRLPEATIDVDSLPIEVEGHQPQSEYNGHYHARIYHPLVVSLAETGDLIAVRLRPGTAHTADGALAMLLPLLDRVEKCLCRVASVRVDAGFPEEAFLAALEARQTAYVARIKNNSVLDRMAAPYLRQPPGRRPKEPRIWFYEHVYRAASWSRERRVVLVVLERPGELFVQHFWLLTSWNPDQVSAEELLAWYRDRGTAEGHMGELMSVLDPALSSSPRPKSHYRGVPVEAPAPSRDSFEINEVRLILNALAYELIHAARVLLEDQTQTGWSLRRVRDRLLRVAARLLRHGRRVTVVLGEAAARMWASLMPGLGRLRWTEP